MNFILKIAPAFLKKFDSHLRTNHPWIWATRIHLNLYLSLVLSLFFILLGLLYQMNPREVITSHDQDFFFGILFIPAVILLGFFIYNMSIYNPDKKAAYRFKYQEFFVLLIYFFTLSLPLLIPYPTSWVLNERIAHIEEEVVLEKQAVSFELGAYFFPSNRDNFKYYPSDSAFLKNINGQRRESGRDAKYYEEKRLENEAWLKMKDSIFDHKGIFKNKRPRLYFSDYVGDYQTYGYYESRRNYYQKANLANFDLEKNSIFKTKKRELLFHPNEGLTKDYINKFSELLFSYSHVEEITTSTVFRDYSMNNYFISLSNQKLKHDIELAASNMHEIREAQNKDVFSWHFGIFQALALTIFCITLVFQVFKNLHWSQLLRFVLFAGLIFTIILVIDGASNFQSGLILIFPFYLSIILAFVSLRGFKLKKFSTLYVQFNIFLSLISPFFFLLLLAYLENVHGFFYWSWFDSYKVIDLQGVLDYGYEHSAMINECYTWAFWIGIFSYNLIWNSYLKSLYLRYWSLPKNS